MADRRPAGNNRRAESKAGHLDAKSMIGDLPKHPAFSGYSQLMMPWSDCAYDETMPFSRFGSLPPYHSHVDPGTVVRGLNHMIDDVTAGKPVFYHFYTETQERGDPTKEQTGLPKPAGVVMAHTAHSDTSSDEPPTCVVVGGEDGIAPASAMVRSRGASCRGAGPQLVFTNGTWQNIRTA